MKDLKVVKRCADGFCKGFASLEKVVLDQYSEGLEDSNRYSRYLRHLYAGNKIRFLVPRMLLNVRFGGMMDRKVSSMLALQGVTVARRW